MIKKIITIILLVIIFLSFSSILVDLDVDNYAKNYLFNNGLEETGSKNLITAIYLDYRLYDSLFEAGLLLVTVSGIIFISKRDDDVI